MLIVPRYFDSPFNYSSNLSNFRSRRTELYKPRLAHNVSRQSRLHQGVEWVIGFYWPLHATSQRRRLLLVLMIIPTRLGIQCHLQILVRHDCRCCSVTCVSLSGLPGQSSPAVLLMSVTQGLVTYLLTFLLICLCFDTV